MNTSGDKAIPIIFLLALVVMSTGVFFTHTLKKAKAKRAERLATAAAEQQEARRKAEEAKGPVAPPQASPAELRMMHVTRLAQHLETQDFGKVAGLFSTEASPQYPEAATRVLARIVRDLGYHPEVAGAVPSPTSPDAFLLPLARGEGDQIESHPITLGFSQNPAGPPFASFDLPLELERQIFSPTPVTRADPQPVAEPRQEPAPDPAALEKAAAEKTALNFVESILGQDYASARELCLAHGLPSEKVAALCFVFEDAAIPPGTVPEVHVTAVTDDTAWAITKIRSESWGQDLEFGMELERRPSPAAATETATLSPSPAPNPSAAEPEVTGAVADPTSPGLPEPAPPLLAPADPIAATLRPPSPADTHEVGSAPTTSPAVSPPAPEPPTVSWGIVGINLSELLASYASRTAAGEIPYAPIVKTPNGGESLALFFPYDSEELHQRSERQLRVIAQLLKADATKKISITGHADALGTDEYNARLSAKRALQVQEFLMAQGITGSQILTEAAGETSPLLPNENDDGTDNPEGRAHNRRAEIYLDF